MKIVIDISPVTTAHKHRGIGAYTRSLVEALKRVDTQNEYILTSQPRLVPADVVHYPYFDFYFLTLPLAKPHASVVTIHDTIPLVFPQAYPPGWRGRVKGMIQRLSLNGVHTIVTDSDCSKRDIERYLNQPENKVRRVYLAADPGYQRPPEAHIQTILNKYSIRAPYFLFVGDVNYNKNLEGLIQAFAQLPASRRLVLVGRALGNDIPPVRHLHHLIEKHHLTERTHLLSQVPMDPKDDLCALYSGAEWYVQPSLYEGFGLPVLEAMQCRTPVIASTGGSLPEIVGDGALTFDPQTPGSLLQTLQQSLSLSNSERETLIERSWRNNQRFSWEKTAREMMEVYEQAAAAR